MSQRHLSDVTAAKLDDLFSKVYAADPAATHALIANRVPCNDALRDHATIQVDVRNISGIFPTVGLLGVLNGICGTARRVAAVFDDQTHCLLRFEAQDFTE